jgi:hypothetical protein
MTRADLFAPISNCRCRRQSSQGFIQAKETLFDGDGNIGADSRKFLQAWMDRLYRVGEAARSPRLNLKFK